MARLIDHRYSSRSRHHHRLLTSTAYGLRSLLTNLALLSQILVACYVTRLRYKQNQVKTEMPKVSTIGSLMYLTVVQPLCTIYMLFLRSVNRWVSIKKLGLNWQMLLTLTQELAGKCCQNLKLCYRRFYTKNIFLL